MRAITSLLAVVLVTGTTLFAAAAGQYWVVGVMGSSFALLGSINVLHLLHRSPLLAKSNQSRLKAGHRDR